MKPVATTMTEVDNLPGEEIKFGIGKGQEAWVMRSMADLYSNRELACVREYSTNAYDSNKELAIAEGREVEPIEVSLPNAMNPYFEIKDRGVGMSRAELAEVYTQFGESTKRDSDEFNGMLGFGSKSAIAYTNTFTVTSVKDGYKNVGVVTRREDAMGGYIVGLKIILDNVRTTEHSGVTINIPVHNAREFEQKARDFYRFWMPGSVVVNGKQPEWAVGEKIDDGLFYYPNANGQNISYVVMGNVPYRIINSDALFPRGMNRISFVAYVPVGTVEFTPSREDLKYSEHTKTNLRKIISDFVAKSVATAKADIAAAKTHAEAYKSWTKWRKVIGAGQVDDLTFKGDKLVDKFDIEGSRYDLNSYRYSTWAIKEWNLSEMERTLIVAKFDINLGAPHRKKVKDWIHLKGMKDISYVIFTAQDSVATPWIDQSRVVSWEKVKEEAPKAPRKARVKNVAWGRKAGSFDLITSTGRKSEQDVPNVTDLYYVMVKDYNLDKGLSNVLKEFGLTHEVVLVPGNRKDKFLRHYPKAKEILPELKSQVVLDGPSLLSDDAKTYLKTERNERQRIAALDASRVSDPDIKSLITLFKTSDDVLLKEYRKQFRLANVLGMGNKFKKHKWQSYWDSVDTPLIKKYPLAYAFEYGYQPDANKNRHVYLYMNACYQARLAGKVI